MNRTQTFTIIFRQEHVRVGVISLLALCYESYIAISFALVVNFVSGGGRECHYDVSTGTVPHTKRYAMIMADTER